MLKKAGPVLLLAALGSGVYYWNFVALWSERHLPENQSPNWLGPGDGYGPCLPPGATDIFAAFNFDSNDQYAAFRFPPATPNATWKEAKSAEPGLVPYRAPRNYAWWDDELIQSALDSKDPEIRLCNETGRSFFVIDDAAARGYAWWVPRGRAHP